MEKSVVAPWKVTYCFNVLIWYGSCCKMEEFRRRIFISHNEILLRVKWHFCDRFAFARRRSFYWNWNAPYSLMWSFIWWAPYGLYKSVVGSHVNENTTKNYAHERQGKQGNQNKCTHLNTEQKYQIVFFSSIQFNCRYIHNGIGCVQIKVPK